MQALLRFNTMTKTASAFAAFSLLMLACLSAQAEAKRTHVTGHEGNYAPISSPRMYSDGVETFVFGAAMTADDNTTADGNPSDQRLTGQVTYHYTVDFGEGMFWGTLRIVPTIGGGEWNGFWQGPLSTDRPISATLLGTGNYAGLVARLNYTHGTVYPYDIDGYIVEAKGGPGDRPFQISSSQTTEVEIHTCVEVGVTPPVSVEVVKVKILNEVMEATHVGRSSNVGFELVDPLNGEFTGTGIATAANGDKMYWVSATALDPLTHRVQGAVHFCGGTGQLDPAFGWFGFEKQHTVVDPANPLISTLFYTGSGTIRY
jgi:hypothetical protein